MRGNYSTISILFLCMAILFIFSQSACAATGEDSLWGNFGVGALTTPSSGSYISSILGVTVNNGSDPISIRIIDSTMILDPRKITEFGILPIKIFNNDSVIVSSGISFISGVRRGKETGSGLLGSTYESLPYNTVGIPVEAQWFLTPSYFELGLNLYFFADINKESSFLGACLTVRLGASAKEKG